MKRHFHRISTNSLIVIRMITSLKFIIIKYKYHIKFITSFISIPAFASEPTIVSKIFKPTEDPSEDKRLKIAENSTLETLHAKIPQLNFSEAVNSAEVSENITKMLQNITEIFTNITLEISNTTEPSSGEQLYFEIFLIIGLLLSL